MPDNNQDPTPTKRSECECECHQEGSLVSHNEPCCVPDEEVDGKDGKDYF